ncbi:MULTISPECIES: carbon-nitrogen hydrolase family protein [unclassified Spirosoma]|uniref:carbon-nitrogen hydrolase family protein n=1 Tax=unclassified Spirosoma TaxID=2621999 RepID=UPI00095B4619|nr:MULTISPECIES: carbon-nitrogen hydrolase family protein [unclassified Spirosoma]MBN8825052.1 carbon-nitrogen hydrolase family protein [Spirosoma sp.]OJW73344.1 MAG: nitrilase [Spirosoma sp. 48-14]
MPSAVKKISIALFAVLLIGWVAIMEWQSWLMGDPAIMVKSSVAGQRIVHIERVGKRSDQGNLLGIQPWMEPADYKNGLTFRQKLQGYLTTAQDSGLLIPGKTVAIFPEYIGTWLVAANEADRVYKAQTIQDGLTAMTLTHPLRFWQVYRSVPDTVGNKTNYTIFALKAQQMAHDYQLTFDMLAAQFNITIVAGSILLPAPTVEHGNLQVGKGPLYNVSAVFHPDGQLDSQLIRKVFPIADELPFVCPSKPADIPIFDLPIGRLGVLICADSWHSVAYKTLRQKGATLLAVPSYSAGDGIWKTIWRGYSGTSTPADAQAAVGKLTEGQAWLTYAMAGRARPEAGITKGINVFLRGILWDLGTDGTTIILQDSTTTKLTPAANGATLTCLWL